MSKLINKAFLFATEKHKGQFYDKVPFIYHPTQVYEIISTLLPEDENLRCAALLHDTIEDCGCNIEEITNAFNEDIAQLVWEVTKEKEGKKPATFPRLKSKRGIILKFADRLSNLSNMQNWSQKKQDWYLKSSVFWFK